jgi:hypothetical protein
MDDPSPFDLMGRGSCYGLGNLERNYASDSGAVHAVFAMFCIRCLEQAKRERRDAVWFQKILRIPAKCRMHDGRSCKMHECKKQTKR